jgi:lysophospholipase L1-like esterase
VQAFGRLEDRLSGKGVERIFVRPGNGIDREAPASVGSGRLFPWYDPARTPEWEPLLAEQEVLVRQLVDELRASNTRLLIAYVPHVPELIPSDPEASRARNPHALRLARLARELDVPFFDGIELFAGPGRIPSHYYFEYDQHWNAAGHALFAEALERRLNRMLVSATVIP